MAYNNIPFSLVSLQLKACSDDTPLPENVADESLFDDRTDFVIDSKQTAVAVLLTFSKKIDAVDAVCSGLRRHVIVSLFDVTSSTAVRTADIILRMKGSENMCAMRVDLPLAYDDVDFKHEYKVCVQERRTGGILGKHDIRLLDGLPQKTAETGSAEAGQSAESASDGNDDFDKMLQKFIDNNLKPRRDEPDDSIDDDIEDNDVDFDNDDLDFDNDDFEDELWLDDGDEANEEPADPKESALSLDACLSQMTGLSSVKAKLATYENVVKFNKMRLDHNLTSNMLPLHAMFLGSPGTGKTTVAKKLGEMLRMAGVLSRGHVVERQRANLLGPNYSCEETNTLEAIEKAQGGILFIDEAYQLYQPDDPRDPGRLVIETLMTALADESKRDWMLILAGYPDEMRRMFDMNPGLRSRIPESNIYIFDDYTENELFEIAENYLRNNSYRLSPEARDALTRRIAADYRNRDKKFGNARYVMNMIQTEILPAMAARVVAEKTVSQETLSVILPADIPSPKIQTCAPRPRIGFYS